MLFKLTACDVACNAHAILIQICSLKGIPWKQRLHQRTETRVYIFPGPD